MLKYDEDDEGSVEARTLGSGVVFRLRGVADGFEPGFALPLLLTFEGAIAGAGGEAAECWGMRGRRAVGSSPGGGLRFRARDCALVGRIYGWRRFFC